MATGHDSPGPGSLDERSLLSVWTGDGRPLLAFVAVGLILSGAFAVFLSVGGVFLPHDVAWLGIGADDLCAMGECRIVEFMFHDRVAFGGTLIAIGTLYLWLVAVPLAAGEAWAWWLFLVSGVGGFVSFLAYIGFGYLDTWHAVATAVLLPAFVAGLVGAHRGLDRPTGIGSLRVPGSGGWSRSRTGAGRALLLLTGAGMAGAGLTILAIGMTGVFVPQDLAFIGRGPAEIAAISDRLIPLIAHDRAGFGGGLATSGLIVAGCVWCARPSRSLWEALVVAGIAGFGAAIGVHLSVAYTEPTHLGPAIVGAVAFALGVALWRPEWARPAIGYRSRARKRKTGSAAA